MGSRLLLQLALLTMVPFFVVQSELKSDKIAIQTASSSQYLGPNASTPLESTSTWGDDVAKIILKNLNKVLIELEVNVFWYKDFIVFDYFEFIY